MIPRSHIFPFITLLTVILSVTACKHHTKTDDLQALVEEWQGKEIIFPEVMTDVLTGDTIEMDDVDFTIITYIDSTGCTGCRMRLPLWNMFIESLDSLLGDKDIKVLIVVNAKDNEGIQDLIHRDTYYHPIINDCADTFNQLNHFPVESAFRSLLLNGNREVLAIGNPTINNGIAELYRSIISGGRVFSELGDKIVTACPSRMSLGTIPVGQKLNVNFTLENQGTDTVYIRDIISSCPCTDVTVSDSVILPRRNLLVNVGLHEDSIIGDFQRYISIFYHDFDNPTVLGLSGTII